MVESTALEMRRTGNRTVGSNPTLSATQSPNFALAPAEAEFVALRRQVSSQSNRSVGMTIRIGTAGWTIPRGVADRFPAEGSSLEPYSHLNVARCNGWESTKARRASDNARACQ